MLIVCSDPVLKFQIQFQNEIEFYELRTIPKNFKNENRKHFTIIC